MLQQAGRLVLDVIQPSRGRILFPKQGDAAVQVRPVVTGDCPWNPGLGDGRLQLPKNHLPVRLGHRHQVDQFYILMAQDPVLGVPGRLADGHDDQAFPLAQLHRVVYDPHPVVCAGFGAVQLVQAQPHQPQPHRRQVARADVGDRGGGVGRGFLWFLPRRVWFPSENSSPNTGPGLSSDHGFPSSWPIGTSGSCSPGFQGFHLPRSRVFQCTPHAPREGSRWSGSCTAIPKP